MPPASSASLPRPAGTVVLRSPLHVVGFELRTHNGEAMQTIPAFWQHVMAGGGVTQVPDRLSDDLYAVYTHFEHAGTDNLGLYSLVIGAAVDPQWPLPPGLVRAVVPAGPRALFPVPDNRNDQVPVTWQRIWQRGDLAKSFIADFEHYSADGSIVVEIGLRH